MDDSESCDICCDINEEYVKLSCCETKESTKIICTKCVPQMKDTKKCPFCNHPIDIIISVGTKDTYRCNCGINCMRDLCNHYCNCWNYFRNLCGCIGNLCDCRNNIRNLYNCIGGCYNYCINNIKYILYTFVILTSLIVNLMISVFITNHSNSAIIFIIFIADIVFFIIYYSSLFSDYIIMDFNEQDTIVSLWDKNRKLMRITNYLGTFLRILLYFYDEKIKNFYILNFAVIIFSSIHIISIIFCVLFISTWRNLFYKNVPCCIHEETITDTDFKINIVN